MKEIVLIMGIQGAGKSCHVANYTLNGYLRLNRDEIGGNLASLNKKLESEIIKGHNKIVLDNTYGTKEQRAEVIAIAQKRGFKIKCVWFKTSIEDAQFNVSKRIINLAAAEATPNQDEVPPLFSVNLVKPELVLGPDGGKYIKSIGHVPAIALFAYQKKFEKPTKAEGFDEIEEVEFKRIMSSSQYNNKALLLDYDGTLRDTLSGDKYPKKPTDIKILPNVKNVLEQWANKGYNLLGVSNQSGVEKGEFTHDEAVACFEQTNKLIGLKIDYKFCPHHSFPIRCFCRKPMPGLGAYFIEKYGLKPSDCIMVGNATSDKTFAKRCGFQYQEAQEFFK